MTGTTFTFLCIGCVCLGLLALWALKIRYELQVPRQDNSIRTLVQLVAWSCILIGVFGFQIQMGVQVSPIMWLITIVVLITSFVRYRIGELRSFLGCLATAAERGVPLEQAARAFSFERTDTVGARAARLATALESGVPISQAVPQYWHRVPFDILLALRVGVATGDLGTSLNMISKPDDQADFILRGILEKLLYLMAITFVLLGILTFVMLKIVPVFARMFQEFELKLPAMTEFSIYLSSLVVKYWFFPVPIYLIFFFFLSIAWLHYLYLLPRDLPLINYLSLKWDAGLVMRSLGFAVRRELPLENFLDFLAEQYPRSAMRERVRTALVGMKNAVPWQSALHHAGILQRNEAALLSAAQRSGNLEWALVEMADSSIRRLTYRIRIIVNFVMPAILFIYGMILGFIVISLFIPLVSLIMGLS